VGVMRNPTQSRLPQPSSAHRRMDFEIDNDAQALDMAASFFRLHKVEGGLL